MTTVAAASPRAPARSPGVVRLVQIAKRTNSFLESTFINNPATNGHPKALLFVTPTISPFGRCCTPYNEHPIGVWYSAGRHKWGIFNEDLAAMPRGVAFYVLVVPRQTSTAFIVKSTSSNTGGDTLTLHKPATNSHPNALLQVTQNWNPGGHSGPLIPDTVGVYYYATTWAIFREDTNAIPHGASFNVLVGSKGTGGFATVLTARSSNTSSNFTILHNRRTDGNSRAMIFATNNWNPGGGDSDVYNDWTLGVWYDMSVSPHRWTVFNESLPPPPMPLGAGFNLLIYRTH